ncbi:branched-chain amino acid transport system substrate-binding protein [Rhodospirillales bacterium URHD0017]|nr:branched-chain amino acid transport system substrate-binding protein [Rhodospirillales bacterium URHD0017]
MKNSIFAAVLAASLGAATAAQAEITVGFITSQSGPGSSIGVLYDRGMKAALEYASSVGAEKIKFIQLDDGSDPSAATRNARKLVEENKVDLLIGTSTAASTSAMVPIANELKVPMIAISPISVAANDAGDRWAIVMPQPPTLMVKVVVDRMKRDGVKQFAYIGFSDAWGDLVYNGAQKPAEADGLKMLTNERYARTDTSVTGQVLKMMAAKPDAVLLGGAATQGALPALALTERGYKGPLYGTPALLNTDFIRVGGKSVEGVQVSAGPVIVAEQLPDSHFSKKISMDFRAAYQKANGTPTSDGFSAYSFDAWLVFLDAAKRAMATGAKPGTPEFRVALKNAIFSTKDLVGTHAIYNYKPSDSYGVDERSLVMVRLVNGQWKFEP